MKVLKKGREQRGWAKEFKCTGKGNGDGGCGAHLLVEAADLFKTESHCRDETDWYTTFKCSECGVLTDVSRSAVDFSVLENLPTKAAWEHAHQDPRD